MPAGSRSADQVPLRGEVVLDDPGQAADYSAWIQLSKSRWLTVSRSAG